MNVDIGDILSGMSEMLAGLGGLVESGNTMGAGAGAMGGLESLGSGMGLDSMMSSGSSGSSDLSSLIDLASIAALFL